MFLRPRRLPGDKLSWFQDVLASGRPKTGCGRDFAPGNFLFGGFLFARSLDVVPSGTCWQHKHTGLGVRGASPGSAVSLGGLEPWSGPTGADIGASSARASSTGRASSPGPTGAPTSASSEVGEKGEAVFLSGDSCVGSGPPGLSPPIFLLRLGSPSASPARLPLGRRSPWGSAECGATGCVEEEGGSEGVWKLGSERPEAKTEKPRANEKPPNKKARGKAPAA